MKIKFRRKIVLVDGSGKFIDFHKDEVCEIEDHEAHGLISSGEADETR